MAINKFIFLTGRDFVNWATDDDYFFTKKAISSFAEFTENLEEADVIHSINWHSLLPIDKNILKNKSVISHVPHDVRHMLTQPEYLLVAPYINYWIVPSLKAKEYADLLSLPNVYVPYGIDTSVFYKVEDASRIEEFKKKYNIPSDTYLIGSFQRDTEGADLQTPKYIKGPDLFLEIIKKVYKKNKNIHVLLSGPRRYWLRDKLKEEDIPNTFVGEIIEGKDDLDENILDHHTINELYNLIDLYIVSSRMEGGPKAITECAATRTKIISTDVGHAKDILDKKQLYDNFITASDLVLEDIEKDTLKKFVSGNYEKTKSHILENISSILLSFYKNIEKGKQQKISRVFKEPKIIKKGFWEKLINIKQFNRKITIYFQFQKPPWGGGNQFLMALSRVLKLKGWSVNNSFKSNSKIFLFNSFHIDFGKIKKLKHNNKLIIHRIDGPTFLVRGKDKELDDNIFSVNQDIADISIFQSVWSLIETFKMGYKPINPVIIPNASDPHIFNSNGSSAFSKNRKIKIVSSSWSDNPNKGGPIYKWLDKNIDWDRFEYTFIGRVSEELSNINVIEPVSSEKLAEILKQHDIYITASDNDPCSNALIEALSCKLPVIYLNGGGHPELVRFGGLGFNEKEEIPSILEIIVENYRHFQNLVVAPNIEAVTNNYIKCMEFGS